MSADNWAICPQCKRVAEAKKAKEIKKANDAYGKVEPEKYLELRDQANTSVELESTMREDYELGVDKEGTFSINYGASCQKCGFRFAYKHEQEAKSDGSV